MYHISYIMYHVSYLIYQNMNDIRYTFQALKACQDAKKEADQKALWRVGGRTGGPWEDAEKSMNPTERLW